VSFGVFLQGIWDKNPVNPVYPGKKEPPQAAKPRRRD